MAIAQRQLLGAVGLLGRGLALGWGAALRCGAAMPKAGGGSAVATATAGAAPSAEPASVERKVLYWYDPMVSTLRFGEPGQPPFMDRQLVPRYAEAEVGAAAPGSSGHSADTANPGGTLALSTPARQALGLRLAMVELQRLGAVIERAVENLQHKLIEAFLVVAGVCAVFLWHLCSALVAIIALPLNVLIA
jgi:Cu(I)/Ag(I) efflux system membrane fusion protein